MDESEAREELKSIKGIGDKVADCILVYSLGFYNVIPQDLWVQRILTDLYKLPKMKTEEYREWINEYFNGNGAFAGQILFEYMRQKK